MRAAFIVLAAAIGLPAQAAAQPTLADAVGTKLRTGDTVYVLDSSAREITGVYGKISDSSITLMVNGDLRDIPFADVRQLTRRGRDTLWNGTLTGAAVGGLFNGMLQGARYAIGGAILWGAIGAAIDKAVDGRVVLYRAPAVKSVVVGPLMSDGVRGVRVAVKF